MGHTSSLPASSNLLSARKPLRNRALVANLLRVGLSWSFALLLVICWAPTPAIATPPQRLAPDSASITQPGNRTAVVDLWPMDARAASAPLVIRGEDDHTARAPQAESRTPSAEVAARPVVAVPTVYGSRFGIAFKTSTLGLGGDFAVRLAHPLNLRIGFTGFNYSRTVPDGDIAYRGTLRLCSLQAVVDWFPWSHAFHFSPGLLLYNGNLVTAKALIPTGKTLSAGTEVFISNPQNPITGSARSAMRKVAPEMLVGFGNLVPRGRRFSFSIDIGVVFQGQPTTSLAILGSACDEAGIHCQDVARDASIQADMRSGEKTMQDALFIFKYYPLVSIEFGYHF